MNEQNDEKGRASVEAPAAAKDSSYPPMNDHEDSSSSSSSSSCSPSTCPITDIESLLSLAKISLPLSTSLSLFYTKITKLDLYQCNLSTLPNEISTWLPNLNILFCMKNLFVEMPAVIGSCLHLQMVSFKSNVIKSIHPEALQKQMKWLILTDNQITYIPQTISRCIHLQKLMLTGNLISELPCSLVHCQQLQLIRLASNQLMTSPMKLLQQLPQLAWIALSDNPFLNNTINNNTTAAATTTTVGVVEVPFHNNNKNNKNELFLNEDEFEDTGIILGSGASGITRKYIWNRINHSDTDTHTTTTTTGNTLSTTIPVAVKTYSSTITSDGNPMQERQIALMTCYNTCPSFISLMETQGPSIITTSPPPPPTNTTSIKIHDAFVQVYGILPSSGSLVMELLPQDIYQVFAQPPNMSTCTRDVYNPDILLLSNIYEAYQMITSLLQVMKHLHSLQICHGDFYGHNILVSSCSTQKRSRSASDLDTMTRKFSVKLTDFGASFLYSNIQFSDDNHNDDGWIIETIEVRAFGHLLSEIHDMLLLMWKNRTTSSSNNNNKMEEEEGILFFCHGLVDLIQYCHQNDNDGRNHTSFTELLELWNSKMTFVIKE